MGRDIWIFLFVIGAVLFNWPILSIFKIDLAEYLFPAWFIFIILIFFVTTRAAKDRDGG